MRPKNANSIKRGKPPKSYPKYPEQLQRHIRRFLVVFAVHCEAMIDRMRVLAKSDPKSQMIQSQVQYWSNALSVARDMTVRTHARQRHLIEVSDETIDGVLQTWGYPTFNCVGPERSVHSVIDSGDSDGTMKKCEPSENGPSENGRKRPRTQSTPF